MYKDKSILAIIPARGGSKGLPGKNIRPLAGKPLIAWTIETAKKSRYVDELIISTDNSEIAAVAREWGCNVPFKRPDELATDESKSIDVILHALNFSQSSVTNFDLVLVLQPTSPLRTTDDIDTAIELLFSKKAGAIVSVCKTEHHPWWSNRLPPNGQMKNFLPPEVINTNRQELPTYYRLNGAIYLADIPYLKKTNTFINRKTFAYIMPKERSIDIDDIIDFKLAEILLLENIYIHNT